MFKAITLYALAFMMSFTIIGPSFIALFESDSSIEIVQDIEEEQSESKKELEEYKKFLNDDFTFLVTETEAVVSSFYYHLSTTYGHIKDVSSPPPDFF